MKSPRDMKNAILKAFDLTAEVGANHVSLWSGDDNIMLPRAEFNRIVDWYIGTPGIVARLRALEELARDVAIMAWNPMPNCNCVYCRAVRLTRRMDSEGGK